MEVANRKRLLNERIRSFEKAFDELMSHQDGLRLSTYPGDYPHLNQWLFEHPSIVRNLMQDEIAEHIRLLKVELAELTGPRSH